MKRKEKLRAANGLDNFRRPDRRFRFNDPAISKSPFFIVAFWKSHIDKSQEWKVELSFFCVIPGCLAPGEQEFAFSIPRGPQRPHISMQYLCRELTVVGWAVSQPSRITEAFTYLAPRPEAGGRDRVGRRQRPRREKEEEWQWHSTTGCGCMGGPSEAPACGRKRERARRGEERDKGEEAGWSDLVGVQSKWPTISRVTHVERPCSGSRRVD